MHSLLNSSVRLLSAALMLQPDYLGRFVPITQSRGGGLRVAWRCPALKSVGRSFPGPWHQEPVWATEAEARPCEQRSWVLSTQPLHLSPEELRGRILKCRPIEHIFHRITEDLEITSFSSIRKMDPLKAVLCSPPTSFISASPSALKA